MYFNITPSLKTFSIQNNQLSEFPTFNSLGVATVATRGSNKPFTSLFRLNRLILIMQLEILIQNMKENFFASNQENVM